MTNKVNQNNKSQIQRANDILVDLRPEITSQDRDDAQKELELSEPTITRYLIGQGKKIETALSLIEFFSRKVSDREKKLKGAEPARA